MSSSPGVAPDVAAYQEWERRAGPNLRTRYADFMPSDPLFEVRPDDIPTVLPGWRIEPSGTGDAAVIPSDGRGVVLRGVSADTLALALSLPDGRKPVHRIAQAARPSWPVPTWCALIQILLGRATDLPATFSACATAIDPREIVRFPEQPAHSLLRNYWGNAAAVRRALPALGESPGSGERFSDALARLHVLATTGEDGVSYYGGYGLIPTVPGIYREIAVQTAIPQTLVRTLDHWSSSLGAGPVSRTGETRTPRGQAMNLVRDDGTVVQHLATGAELQSLLDEAGNALASADAAAAASRTSDLLFHLAVFHQIFVNAHPFANINHSIAMNIVNHRLRAAGIGCLPHLFLDYLAQRLPPDRFAPAFAEVAGRHALHKDGTAGQETSLATSAALYWRYRADRDGTAATT